MSQYQINLNLKQYVPIKQQQSPILFMINLLSFSLSIQLELFFFQFPMLQGQEDHTATDKQIYQYIYQKSHINLRVLQNQYTHHFSLLYLLLNCMFKLVLILHFNIQNFVDRTVGIWISTQFIIFMIIVDFWFTKNICGRGLLGLRWFFDQDPYGVWRFMYEARVNPEFVHWIYKRLFWLIQVSYAILGYVDIDTIFGIQYSIFDVSTITILVAVSKIITSAVNLYLFYKAHSDCQEKRENLKNTHGEEFIRKLGSASMVVYY